MFVCLQGHQRSGVEERVAEGDGEAEGASEDPGEVERGELQQDALSNQTGGASQTTGTGINPESTAERVFSV